MVTSKILVRFLNIRTSELHKVLTLSCHAFFSGLGISLAFSAINLLLIKKHGTEFLPIIYMVSMIFLLLTGRIYNRLEHKMAPAKLFSRVIMVMAIWAVLSFLIIGEGAFWMTAALYCSYFLIYLLNNLEFWGASALLFDVRQSKRVFGFLNSGESLAKIIGYSLTPLIVTILDESYLLLVAGIAFGISGLFWRWITRHYESSFDVEHHGHKVHLIESESTRKSATDLLIRKASFLALFGVVVITIVEFAFLNKVEKSFDSATQVAIYFGAFFGASKFINLVVELIMSGRMIESLGLRRSLLLLPVSILVFAMLAIGFGRQNFFDTEGYFILFVLMMMVDVVFYSAVHKPAFMSIFQPLTKESRLAAHTLVKGISEPIGVGIGGFVLWMLISSGIFNFTVLSIAIALFSIWWIITGLDATNFYGVLVQKMMRSRLLNQDTLPTLLNNMEELEETISQKDDPFNKLYLLQLSGDKISEAFCIKMAQSLLDASYPEDLLVAALNFIEGRNTRGVDVSHLLEHRSQNVVEAAIKTYSSLEQEDCVDRLLQIAEQYPNVRETAYASLLKNGGLFAATKIGHHVLAWQNSADPLDRLKACQVIGDTGIKSYYQPLLALLDDPDVTVRKAAIHAAGQVRHTKLVPMLIENALRPGYFESVFRAIQRFASSDFVLISDQIEGMDDDECMKKLIRLLSANSGETDARTLQVLYGLFDHHSSLIRTEVIDTLFILNPNEKNHDLLEAEWLNECRSIGHLQKNWLARKDDHGMLADTIGEERHNKIIRLLKITGLLYQKRLLLKVIDNFELGNEIQLSNTLEALDIVLNNFHRKRLMNILEFDQEDHMRDSRDDDWIEDIFMDAKGLYSDWLKAVIVRNHFGDKTRSFDTRWRAPLIKLKSRVIEQELGLLTI